MVAARKKGLAIMKQPIIATFGSGSRWMETFERIVDQNVEYVLLIDSKEEDTHGLLKYYEALYKVITQVYINFIYSFIGTDYFFCST